MKPFSMISSILVVSLAIATPNLVFAHVGHGDEFQAEGGIERVQVNPETDSMLGIVVTPIEQATADGNGVMVPTTALVDSDGKQLVFVQYENFYEPVPVTTGATQGELIEVTQGLSVGENLVTQGSLSLYAESRKTQTVDVAASPAPTSSPQTDITHAQADAQGIPHSHDTTGNLVQSDAIAQQTGETTQESGGFPMGILAALAGGVALLVGGFVVMGNRKNKV
ncbi:MAG: cobalt transporter [Limnoraphis robusta]|uniref:Cobalt transporter n=1 Tax=Limnoraphis robusta CS-951 TaxID=1637645 RepID=A0A0F5Y9Y8_9CYAN|nr:cobalt transporter [Limnoraphis robusta]KKD35736.1 cobalt transporter [Limnoraphis robusta CS-951]MEA5499535.1 cobalt transporter [Limnoraphis robusta BA-68 BA1]